MGFFDDIGNAISDAADAVADVVEDVVNAVEEVVTDVVETVGSGIEDGLSAVGDFLSGIPVVGGIVGGFFHWVGDFVSAAFDLVGAIVKGVLGIVGGVIAGVIRIVFGGIGGLLAWDATVFVKGWGDIFSSIAGGVVLILGKALSLIQAIFFLQWGERPLTKNERTILERVFRQSVALYNVRVIEGFAGLFSINSRPFTLGNTIYMKDTDPATNPAVLVHECTHAWQYQNLGARYTSDAIWAQWTADNAYDWEGEIGAGKTHWWDFNGEAQGAFMENLYLQGRVVGTTATGNGEFYNDDPVGSNVEFMIGRRDHTPLAVETVAHVRGAFAWRLSGLF